MQTKSTEQTMNEIMSEMGIYLEISNEDIIKFLAKNPRMAVDYLECRLLEKGVNGGYSCVNAIDYFERKAKREEETIIEKGVDITITRNKSNVWLTLLTYLLILSGGLLLGYQLKADYVNAYHSNPSKILPMNLK